MRQPTDKAIIIFDGVCNLCNTFVNFVIDHDPHHHFQFVAGQSATGQALLEELGLPTSLDTIVLIQAGQHYTYSTAVLQILRQLKGRISALYYLIGLPRWIRDTSYRLIAQNRYRWMGKSATCRIPTPELQQRFLP
jgi:predicted DCC family thiol-disulfide oxidoreductase YuxK